MTRLIFIVHFSGLFSSKQWDRVWNAEEEVGENCQKREEKI